MGGGPIGIEMAQAWRRLGAAVTIVEAASSIMRRDEPRLVAILRQQLTQEGINIIESTAISHVTGQDGDIMVTLDKETTGDKKTTDTLNGSHLLVAVGRQPNLNGLDLEQAGIAYTRTGITTDNRLRSSNRRVFAIGDVSGRQQFTHIAGYHAGIAIRNMLFRLPARIDDSLVPWVTYTDPELAHVGMTMDMATAAGHNPIQLITPLAENDRARAERRTEGMIIAVTNKKGRILGASILAPHAGEMIGTWAVAITAKASIKTMASHIAPYPTYGEASKRTAGAFYTPKLFSPRVKRLVRFMLKWF
jgi:pyruvate/2-oxoglutarate dehydrogenase complex dihydrolipoamide dehydrogenase (E3) component